MRSSVTIQDNELEDALIDPCLSPLVAIPKILSISNMISVIMLVMAEVGVTPV